MEKVKLNFTCPLRLSDFDQTSVGFHCGMCKKSIVDFRGKAKKEVDTYRAERKTENICGLFHKEQVVDVMPDFYEPSPSFFRAPFYKRVQLVMVICLATILFSCKEESQPQGKSITIWDKVDDLEVHFARDVSPGQMLQTSADSLKAFELIAPDVVNGDISEPEPVAVIAGGIGSTAPDMIETETNSKLFYADEMPEFPGGMNSLTRFIGEHLEYPEQAVKEEIQGKVYVRFVIKKDGTAADLEMLRGIGLENEFKNSISNLLINMPKWKPGKQNGIPVDVYFTLPLKFVLPDAFSKETESIPITKNCPTEKLKQRDEAGMIIYPKKRK